MPSHLHRANRQTATRRTDCLVHQLLESQRQHPPPGGGRGAGGRRRGATGDTSISAASVYDGDDHDLDQGEYSSGSDYPPVQAMDESGERGLDRAVDPKAKDKIELRDALKKGEQQSLLTTGR